jgi:hypothetical protein
MLAHAITLFFLMFCCPNLWAMDNAGAYEAQKLLAQQITHKEWDPNSLFSVTAVHRYNRRTKTFTFKGDLLNLDADDLKDIRMGNYMYEPEFKKMVTRLNKKNEAELVAGLFLGVSPNDFNYSYDKQGD